MSNPKELELPDPSHEKPHTVIESDWAIMKILSCITPKDVCRLALVSKAFKETSNSDIVWNGMLPNGWSQVIDKVDGGRLQFASKKELYFLLCNPLSLNNGIRSYWIDRATGGECYMLSAAALSITWGYDTRYWEWIPHKGSRFREVASLQIVYWFELVGRFREVLRPGMYTISFRYRLGRGNSRDQYTGTAFGWEGTPIKLSVSTSDGQLQESVTYLETDVSAMATDEEEEEEEGWWEECDAGEFRVEDSEEAIEVDFAMRETQVLGRKGGFVLEGAIIRPSYLVRETRSRNQSKLAAAAVAAAQPTLENAREDGEVPEVRGAEVAHASVQQQEEEEVEGIPTLIKASPARLSSPSRKSFSHLLSCCWCHRG